MKNKLYFYFGGFGGPFYKILYKNKQFEINLGNVSSNKTFCLSCPSKDKWDEFWLFLDKNKVWGWNKKYINQNVIDGTQWEIEFSNYKKKVKSYGSNKFPSKKLFKKLVSQIEILFNFKLNCLKDEI